MTALATQPRSLEQWLRYQQGVHASPIDLSLERVREVARGLGLLERRCPVAIVGGTNGKGSTASMLASLLRACGWRVGLFTSPHLVHYRERIQIDGIPVSEAALVDVFAFIEKARGSTSLTFFEYSTLAALESFRRAAVEFMVLEVGLGGRLDATNILDADIALLCSVGMDHRDWLGDTLEKIGAEKAGIFRPSQKVVLGSPDVPQSVWRRLHDLQCLVWTARGQFDWHIEGHGYALEPWHYHSPVCRLDELPAPALVGAIQYGNAASAIAAVQLLGIEGSCELPRVAEAMRSVLLPGRFQIIPREVEWVLDVAHNEPAAQVLAGALAARPASGRTLAVVGMLADKDAGAVADTLDAMIDEWLLVGIRDEPRGLTAEQLAARLPPLRGSVRQYGSVTEACVAARALAKPSDRIVVLGSFLVVGPALSWLGLY